MSDTNDTYDTLLTIVNHLDARFPDGNDVFQRVSRLCEESGELAMAVNHRERTGVKVQKHGEPSDEQLVKEVQDVLRAAIGIAKHYGLEDTLRESIDEDARNISQ